MSKETMLKIKFYIISILILLVLAVFIDIKLFDSNGAYLDLCELICCNWFSIISIVFIIMGFIFLLLQNHELNGAANPCCRITKIENVNYEFLTFLTTYIIPLICFDFDKTRYKIVFLILLIIIGIVFVKMNLYVANPILAIMGYRLYKVSVDKKKDNKDILVISRSELFNNDSIDWIKLDDTCWYVKGEAMNVQEIKSKINSIISKNTSLNLFFLLTDKDGQYIKRKVDLAQGDTTEEFIELFREYLEKTIVQNEELSLCKLSSSDDRVNAIYAYDYDIYPKDLNCIHDFNIEEEIESKMFSFSEESLSNLRGYLIYLGSMNEGIVLYKKHYPVSLIKRDSFLLYKKDRRFVKFEGDDILRISGSAQVMKLENEMFVLDINNFERNFGFENLITKRASETVEEIDQKGILEDVQVLKDLVDDITFARKLSKVREKSPVINLSISNDDIINFTKTNPGLRGRFKYSEDGKKIRLDTKASKNAFIKLLNDDYLRSNLTNQEYDSIAKDRIDADRQY